MPRSGKRETPAHPLQETGTQIVYLRMTVDYQGMEARQRDKPVQPL